MTLYRGRLLFLVCEKVRLSGCCLESEVESPTQPEAGRNATIQTVVRLQYGATTRTVHILKTMDKPSRAELRVTKAAKKAAKRELREAHRLDNVAKARATDAKHDTSLQPAAIAAAASAEAFNGAATSRWRELVLDEARVEAATRCGLAIESLRRAATASESTIGAALGSGAGADELLHAMGKGTQEVGMFDQESCGGYVRRKFSERALLIFTALREARRTVPWAAGLGDGLPRGVSAPAHGVETSSSAISAISYISAVTGTSVVAATVAAIIAAFLTTRASTIRTSTVAATIAAAMAAAMAAAVATTASTTSASTTSSSSSSSSSPSACTSCELAAERIVSIGGGPGCCLFGWCLFLDLLAEGKLDNTHGSSSHNRPIIDGQHARPPPPPRALPPPSHHLESWDYVSSAWLPWTQLVDGALLGGAGRLCVRQCDVAVPLDTQHPSLKVAAAEAQLVIFSYVLTELRGRWSPFVASLYAALRPGTLILCAEPTEWQPKALLALCTELEAARGNASETAVAGGCGQGQGAGLGQNALRWAWLDVRNSAAPPSVLLLRKP